MRLDDFLKEYNELYKNMPKIKGTALFFAREIIKIPPYMANTMFNNNIIYEDNIIVSLIKTENPYGISGSFKSELADGLRVFEIYMGYMEVVDVETLLKENGIEEKTIFYGLEDIVSDNVIWRIYSMIKKLTPALCNSINSRLTNFTGTIQDRNVKYFFYYKNQVHKA